MGQKSLVSYIKDISKGLLAGAEKGYADTSNLSRAMQNRDDATNKEAIRQQRIREQEEYRKQGWDREDQQREDKIELDKNKSAMQFARDTEGKIETNVGRAVTGQDLRSRVKPQELGMPQNQSQPHGKDPFFDPINKSQYKKGQTQMFTPQSVRKPGMDAHNLVPTPSKISPTETHAINRDYDIKNPLPSKIKAGGMSKLLNSTLIALNKAGKNGLTSKASKSLYKNAEKIAKKEGYSIEVIENKPWGLGNDTTIYQLIPISESSGSSWEQNLPVGITKENVIEASKNRNMTPIEVINKYNGKNK